MAYLKGGKVFIDCTSDVIQGESDYPLDDETIQAILDKGLQVKITTNDIDLTFVKDIIFDAVDGDGNLVCSKVLIDSNNTTIALSLNFTDKLLVFYIAD